MGAERTEVETVVPPMKSMIKASHKFEEDFEDFDMFEDLEPLKH